MLNRPLCYFCAGRMLPISKVNPDTWKGLAGDDELFNQVNTARDEVYVCLDCEAVLFRGLPQMIIDKNIENELKDLTKGMIHKHQGNRTGRRRKKKQSRFTPWYQR